jgi:hypothetical protein
MRCIDKAVFAAVEPVIRRFFSPALGWAFIPASLSEQLSTEIREKMDPSDQSKQSFGEK